MPIASHRRICTSKMIVSKEQSANLTFDIQLSGCEEKYNVYAITTMDGEKNKLYLNFSNPQHWLDFKFDGKNRTKPTNQALKPITSGFIPKFGGYLAVVSERLHFTYEDLIEEGATHNTVVAAYLIASSLLLLQELFYFAVFCVMSQIAHMWGLGFISLAGRKYPRNQRVF